MLPPGTRTLADLHAERDPIHKVVGAATLLEYVLRSVDPGRTDEEGRPLSLGGLIHAHGVKLADSGGALFGNRVRNDLVHAGRERTEPLTQREIADAGRRLLEAVEEVLPGAPDEVQRAVGVAAAGPASLQLAWLVPWLVGTVLGFASIWGVWWGVRWVVVRFFGGDAADAHGGLGLGARIGVVLLAAALVSFLWLVWRRVGTLHAGGHGPHWIRPALHALGVLLLVLGTYIGLEGFDPAAWMPLLGLGLAVSARAATLRRR